MTDSVMSFVPEFIRSMELGCAFTLGYGEELLWYDLNEDNTIIRNKRLYVAYDDAMFSEEERETVELIHQTLLGEN